MVLQRLRPWSRALAVLLVLASLRGLPYLETDDLACLPLVEEHDETKHGIRPGGAHQPDHCAVCHLARSLRAPRPSLALWISRAPVSAAVFRDRLELPRPPVVDYLPARAPPAPLL